ncbi:MAG: alpha/beta hydrolase-fold protein, partial [Myxococcales bacterium]
MIRHVPVVLLCAAVSCGSSSRVETSPTSFANVRTASFTVVDRTATIYLPGFAYDERTAYFLVLNDGQDVAALGLVATLADLWSKGQLAPVVVIALPAVDRLQQYGTVEHDATIACDSDGQMLGTKAAEYQRYVIDQVLPAAERAVGFRPAGARTGILGASLGGLS